VINMPVGDQRHVRRTRQDGQIGQRVAAFFLGMEAAIQDDARVGSTHKITIRADFRATA